MVTGSCRPFSQCMTRWENKSDHAPTPVDKNRVASQQEQEEDSIEQLDPKDYPELYAQEEEEDEQVDTEWFVDHDEQDFVPLWQQRAMGDHLRERQSLEHISKQLIETGDMSPELLKALLEENKMENVRVMDVRGRCDFTDYMIVAESSMGDRFLTNAAELLRTTVNQAIRKHHDQGIKKKDLPTIRIEGRDDQSGWVLVDLGQCVVHLFTPEVRQHYDLDGLWNQENNPEQSQY
ncbi:DUF143-domain-containing protein [Lichtheimia hyalospora FSU 10163]|nr:DUF143-domain-containing protein [Lichtheimia hyalospora FSU 10163]